MPSYSFKEHFVPMVVDGTKPHTIRTRRKYPAKVGDKLYLFFGMRTKWCRKLREEKCLKTGSIFINSFGQVYIFSGLLSSHFSADGLEQMSQLWQMHKMKFNSIDNEPLDCHVLSPEECDRLAWLDGFRPPGTTLEAPGPAFNVMHRYWAIFNQLPFLGDIIYWNLDFETNK